MSYRCEVCREVCPPRQSRLVHVVPRVRPSGREEIDREVPVCRECKRLLDGGAALKNLYAIRWKAKTTPAPDRPEPPPPEPERKATFIGEVLGEPVEYHHSAGGVARVRTPAPNGGGARLEPRPTCDLCGARVGAGDDGQVTADAVICRACLERKAAEGGGDAPPGRRGKGRKK